MKVGKYAEVREQARWPARGMRHGPGTLGVMRFEGDALLLYDRAADVAVLFESLQELETAYQALYQVMVERREARRHRAQNVKRET